MPSILRDSLFGLAGGVAAQIAAVGALPVLTRLFPPAAFGEATVWLTLVSLAAPIATMRLSTYVVLPHSDRRGLDVLRLAYVVAVAAGLATLGMALVVASVSEWEVSSALAVMASAGVTLVGWQQSEISWLSRQRRFRAMALARFAETCIDRIVAIIAGLIVGPFPAVLVAGRLAGLLGSWGLLRQARHVDREMAGIAWVRVRVLARQRSTWKPGLALGYLADALGRSGPVLLIALHFSTDAAGHYALAVMAVGLPVLLLGEPMAQEFLRRSGSREGQANGIAKEVSDLNTVAFAVFVPLVALLLFLGGDVFALAFGSEWAPAGDLAGILILSAPAAFLHRVAGVLFEVTGRTGQRVVWDVGLAVARILSVTVGALAGLALPEVAVLLAVCGVVGYGAPVILILKATGLSSGRPLIQWRVAWCGAPLVAAAAVTLLGDPSHVVRVGLWAAALMLSGIIALWGMSHLLRGAAGERIQ